METGFISYRGKIKIFVSLRIHSFVLLKVGHGRFINKFFIFTSSPFLTVVVYQVSVKNNH